MGTGKIHLVRSLVVVFQVAGCSVRSVRPVGGVL